MQYPPGHGDVDATSEFSISPLVGETAEAPGSIDELAPISPAEVAELLTQYVHAGNIETCDFERLRKKLFKYCPELRDELVGEFDYSNLPPTHEDPMDNTYVLVGNNPKRKKTASGLMGGFYMSSKLVTVGAYQIFLDQTDYDFPRDLMAELSETLSPDSPMVQTTWLDALAYTQWLCQISDEYYSLPYQEEWSFAGEALADKWDDLCPEAAGTVQGGSWVVPGFDSYGTMGDSEDARGPANTGIVWEWCYDQAHVHGDSRVLCSGIWPSAANAHAGTNVREHALKNNHRIVAAGFRVIALPDACVWHSNRGTLANPRAQTSLEEYLIAVTHVDNAPGSPALADDRPLFYFELPEDQRLRIDSFLAVLHQIDVYNPDPPARDQITRSYSYDVAGAGSLSLPNVRPMDDDPDKESSICLPPDETRIQVNVSLATGKRTAPKPRSLFSFVKNCLGG